MNTISAEYFDGKSSRPTMVMAELSAKGLTVFQENGVSYSVRMSDVVVQPKIGSLPRVLDLPDNSCLHINDHQKLESLLPHKKDFIHLLENNKKFVVGSFLSLGVFAALMYFIVIPYMALVLAPKMTELFGERLTRETIAYLETISLMEKERNEKYTDRLESIRSFEAMAPYDHYEIVIYDTPTIGANAFALPSNTIIVTRQLMDLIDDDTQILAILLHEVGHVQKFHVMQRIIGDSVISMAMLTLFGADWTSLPMVVLSTGYSRTSEREADIFAAQLLSEQDLPPSLLADALEQLDVDYKKRNGDNFLKYFSSHPSTSERSEYLNKYRPAIPAAP